MSFICNLGRVHGSPLGAEQKRGRGSGKVSEAPLPQQQEAEEGLGQPQATMRIKVE